MDDFNLGILYVHRRPIDLEYSCCSNLVLIGAEIKSLDISKDFLRLLNIKI